MGEKQPNHVKPTYSDTPSVTSTSTNGYEDSGDRPTKTRRTFLTQNACTRCRQKKSKCDGKRPTCARCVKHNAECIYDVAQEGITRMQNLQNQLTAKTEDYDKLKKLFDALHGGTDQEATTLLARLRLGDSTDDLLAYVGESQPSSSMHQAGRSPTESGYLSRWPSSPPMQEGYWTTASETSSRNQSFSSASQIGSAGSESKPPPPGSTLAIRDGYRQSEGQGSYFHPGAQHGQNIPYNPVQWQGRERPGDASPFYTDLTGGQMQQRGQPPRRREH